MVSGSGVQGFGSLRDEGLGFGGLVLDGRRFKRGLRYRYYAKRDLL